MCFTIPRVRICILKSWADGRHKSSFLFHVKLLSMFCPWILFSTFIFSMLVLLGGLNYCRLKLTLTAKTYFSQSNFVLDLAFVFCTMSHLLNQFLWSLLRMNCFCSCMGASRCFICNTLNLFIFLLNHHHYLVILKVLRSCNPAHGWMLLLSLSLKWLIDYTGSCCCHFHWHYVWAEG